MNRPLRVTVACSGLGRVRRGYESFADECFDALRRSDHIHPSLIHGPGVVSRVNESAAWLIPHRAPLVQAYAWMRARGHKPRQHYEAFSVEQYSFGLTVAWHAARNKTDVIFFSESQLGAILGKLRRWFGLRYKTVFSNGGPTPAPFPYCDHVQQLTPAALDVAVGQGVPDAKQSMVPYGFAMPAPGPADRTFLRRILNLPVDRPVVISVAAINRSHKRINYLIDEITVLGRGAPYVLFLGQLDDESELIKKQAAIALGRENYRFATVPTSELGQYYQASDLFVLSSLSEAFGRVIVEAMSYGLPCLVHDYPISHFVLGDLGYYGDFSAPGGLTDLLSASLRNLPELARSAVLRQTAARTRFGWDHLLPAYEQMFYSAAGKTLV